MHECVNGPFTFSAPPAVSAPPSAVSAPPDTSSFASE